MKYTTKAGTNGIWNVMAGERVVAECRDRATARDVAYVLNKERAYLEEQGLRCTRLHSDVAPCPVCGKTWKPPTEDERE